MDHLVGADEDGLRHHEAQRLGRFHAHKQLEARGLLHGEAGALRVLLDLAFEARASPLSLFVGPGLYVTATLHLPDFFLDPFDGESAEPPLPVPRVIAGSRSVEMEEANSVGNP